MPASIKFNGRFGNNLFQYITTRIFCEKNCINLNTELNNDIVNFTNHKYFDDDLSSSTQIIINSQSYNENDELNFYGKNINYEFNDYFQNCNYINNNINLINKFFILPEIKKNNDDIVLHLRLDDYLHTNNISYPYDWNKSEIIHPNYYKNILKLENFNKLYIVVNNINYNWEREYLSNFNEYSPIFITQTPKEDFNFIRNFNKIITSNSTFCYWAAFLSDAEKIYTFNKTGYYGKDLIKHGEHVKNLDNIKNKSISINEDFYFGK